MRAILVSMTLLLLAPAIALAEDPPGRVGRVAVIDGKLSEHTPGDATWFPATRNDPVAAGAGFWAEPGARAELSVGADFFRLDGGSELTIERLDDDATGLILSQGTMRVTSATQRPLQVNTPRGDVDVNGRAEIHVDAGTEHAPTRIAVLNGEAVVRTDDGEKRVRAGETAILDGDGPYRSEVRPGVEHSRFDDWADSRLQAEQAPAPRFVSPETTGYQDLAAYGAWQEEPAYGAVWYPRDVPDDWAPYRYGHWRSVAPWGWTWVDDSPWGYAPFHYGRWAYVGNRWGWVPGSYVARPVWAPALVAFAVVGSGGPVGWVPLAPREPYRPWYSASPRYLRAVNLAHVANIRVIQRAAPISYANRSFATAVPQAVFAHGGPIGRAHEAVDPGRFSFNRGARAASPVAMRAALPPAAAPQHAASAAPPAPPLQARPSRAAAPAGFAGRPAHRPDFNNAPPSLQPTGRPALPRDDAARAARPERFEGQRPSSFARPDAGSSPGGWPRARAPEAARRGPEAAPAGAPQAQQHPGSRPDATLPWQSRQGPRPEAAPQAPPRQGPRPEAAPQAPPHQGPRPEAAPQPHQGGPRAEPAAAQPQPQQQHPQHQPHQGQPPQGQPPQQRQPQPEHQQHEQKKQAPTQDDPSDRSKSR
jgi:hypothetical protein